MSPLRITSACAILLAALGTSAMTGPAGAVTAGFVEHFTPPGVGTWTSGATLSNPGTDGALGAADGFLRMSRTGFAAQLGAHSSGPEYSGDWIAADVSHVRLRLKDVDAVQALEIHFSIGNSSNLWQYNPGYVPTANWGDFVIDLNDSLNFTQIIAFDTGFSNALRAVDRILIRHDRAPFVQQPNAILGEFGVDEIELLRDPPVPARPSSWGALKGLYR